MGLIETLFGNRQRMGGDAGAPPSAFPGGIVEMPQGAPPTRKQNNHKSLIAQIANGLNRAGDELLMPTTGLGKFGAYLGAASGAPTGLASMAAMRDKRAGDETAAENAFKQAQMQEMIRKANLPRIEHIGGMIGTVDQNSGSFSPTFTAPRPEESYATGLGYQKGSPEWATALKDYVLRGSGPTAYEFDEDLEGVRQNNREQLEGVRQGNRLSLRSQPTYSQTHPRPSRAIPGGIPDRRSSIVTVNTPAEALRLPSGTKFRTKDGQMKVRP